MPEALMSSSLINNYKEKISHINMQKLMKEWKLTQVQKELIT